MHSKIENKPTLLDKKKVLTRAIQRLAIELALSRQELASILCGSDSKVINSQSRYIDPSSIEGQLAILLLRLYKSLNALFGGNTNQSQLWLRSENKHLGGIPIDLIQSIEGLVITVQYLEAVRGNAI